MRNLDAVAKALVDSRWDYMNESGRGYVREYATAAIDAYRTLTDEQWDEMRYKVAGAQWSLTGLPAAHAHLDPESWQFQLESADAALTALGFRRAGDTS